MCKLRIASYVIMGLEKIVNVELCFEEFCTSSESNIKSIDQSPHYYCNFLAYSVNPVHFLSYLLCCWSQQYCHFCLNTRKVPSLFLQLRKQSLSLWFLWWRFYVQKFCPFSLWPVMPILLCFVIFQCLNYLTAFASSELAQGCLKDPKKKKNQSATVITHEYQKFTLRASWCFPFWLAN